MARCLCTGRNALTAASRRGAKIVAWPAALIGLCALLLAPAIIAASLTSATAQTRGAVSADFRVALEPYGAWHSHKRWGAVG